MNYEEAKEYKEKLQQETDAHSSKLKEFNKYGKNDLGMTPDHVRSLPEWKEAKQAYDKSFTQLRNFNGWFIKAFKKEYAAERRNKYKTS